MTRLAVLAGFVSGLSLATGLGGASHARQQPVGVDPASRDDAFELLESFLGMDWTLGGMSPDVSLAVGRRHLLIVRNTGIALWRKAEDDAAAQSVDAISLSLFFAPIGRPGDRLTDPVAVFDDEAGRFFVVNAAYNVCPDCGFHLLAVSKSPFPETLSELDWYFYRFDRGLERTRTGITKTSYDGDYDNLAAVGNRLLIGSFATQHTAHPDGSSSVAAIGGRVRVLDKDALVAGETPDTWIDLLPSAPSNAKARLAVIPDSRDRAGQPDRAFLDLHSLPPCGRGGGTWIIGAVTGLGASPAITTRSFGSPEFSCSNESVASQPDGARPININHLAVQPVYRDGTLWVFEVRGAAPQDSRAAIVWMELDVRGWPDVRVLQRGVYSEPGVSVFAPAATLDLAGNLVMVYTRSGANAYPSIYYTGRLVTDPQNTLRPGRRLQSGARSFDWRPPQGSGQSFNQFIDYGTATVDPVDGSLWITALVPTPEGRSPGGFERSDAWIGRVRPLDATPSAARPAAIRPQ